MGALPSNTRPQPIENSVSAANTARHCPPGQLASSALDGGEQLARAEFIPDPQLNPFFEAVIQAIDEAVLNSMVANETMEGCDDHVVHALPHDEVRRLLRL